MPPVSQTMPTSTESGTKLQPVLATSLSPRRHSPGLSLVRTKLGAGLPVLAANAQPQPVFARRQPNSPPHVPETRLKRNYKAMFQHELDARYTDGPPALAQ